MPEVIVSIYNHKYRLAVSTGEEDLLRDCAAQIDRQMEAMKASGKVIAADQIAVLTALEVAYEAKKAEEAAHTDEDLEHVRRLCRLCEDAIFRDTKIGALF